MKTKKSHVLYHDLEKEYPVIEKGEGVYIFDKEGNRYLDAVGSVGVVNIGYGVKEVIDSITKQAEDLAFSYTGFSDNMPQQELAFKLQQWSPRGMGETKTLFSSGGAEANEGALKIAYQYHYERGKPGKRKIIGRWQSYHGNSIGALSLSGRTQWRKMHDSLLLNFPHINPPYCYRCPWDRSYPSCNMKCANSLRDLIRQEGPENIAAFIAEPIIGTSMSAVVPPPEYYPTIRDICDEYDILLIVDEVMSGIGRTGKNWGIDNWDVTPDMITASKGISGGYSPLGALVIKETVWQTIANGSGEVMHSCTYGGNPLSCAAGVAALSYIEKNDLVSKAKEMGEKLHKMLDEKIGDFSCVGEIRGRGLFIGVELVADKKTKEPFPAEWKVTSKVVQEAFRNGLIILGGVKGMISGHAGDHFELLPPYIIEEEHLNFIVETLSVSISEVVSKLRS